MGALPSETCYAISDCGFESRSVGALVSNRPAKARMQLVCACDASHFRDVSRVETPTRQDPDAIASLLEKGSKNGRAA